MGCYELSAEDRVLQLASLNFDLAAEEIYPTLASGATPLLSVRGVSVLIGRQSEPSSGQ